MLDSTRWFRLFALSVLLAITATDPAAGAAELSMVGFCPGPMTASLTNGPPGAEFRVFFSREEGSMTVPGGVCAGLELDLESPVLLRTGVLDDAGEMRRGFAPSAGRCGLYVQFVTVSGGSCAVSNVAQIPTEDLSPDEGELEVSPGVLSIEGLDASGFNPPVGEMVFRLVEESFSPDTADYVLLLNGLPADLSSLTLEATTATISYVFDDGRNDLLFLAADSTGRPVEFEETFWAGSADLDVTVIDEAGDLVPGADVELALVDDERVRIHDIAVDGTLTVANVPIRTHIVTATDRLGRIGTVAGVGGEESLTATLVGLRPPSPIDNNDFSLGTDGWEIGDTITFLLPHEERPEAGSEPVEASGDLDLMFLSIDEGPESISRTFTTSPGVKSVSVRYKFITPEVPGGFFGSAFNDYFSVVARSDQGGGLVEDSNSMNGLGLGAFDSDGATDWREQALVVDVAGDTVQVDLTVANVGDDVLDPQVIVDLVEEKPMQITSVALADIDGGALTGFSASPHGYFGGTTRVHGTIRIAGNEGDELADVALDIIQNGSVVASATLAPSARGPLLRAFPPSEVLEIATTELLFELPAAQAAAIDGSLDGTLSLRARARTADGTESTVDLRPPVTLYVRYRGANRYGGRDGARGGDDWALPSTRDLLDHYASSIQVGDISNMHGGSFLPCHRTHREGTDVDGWFFGYNRRDAATAQTLLDLLNDPAFGPKVALAYVTYDPSPGRGFFDRIDGVTLQDGRLATEVIRPLRGHTTHFHWRVVP